MLHVPVQVAPFGVFFLRGGGKGGAVCVCDDVRVYILVLFCFRVSLHPAKCISRFFCVCFPNMTRMRQERHTRSLVCVEEASAEICFPLC